MEKGIIKPSILVVADDFMGTNGAGASLVQVGYIVDMAFEMHYRGDVSVQVISGDGWAMDPELAAMKITSLTSHLPLADNPPFVIKKIDSTLRGNIGAETGALMKACDIMDAVVAPTFPQVGRTTVASECWVNGVRITKIEFASDPKAPVLSARIAGITRLQTIILCQPATVSQFSHLSYEQPWINVIDAQTDSDLDRIAAAMMQAKQPLLLIGSAGTCNAVARRSAIMPPPTMPIIVGPMNEVAQRQIAIFHSHPCITQIYVDVEHILAGNASDYDACVVQVLQEGDHCTVRTYNDFVARHQTDILYQCWQMSRTALGEKICWFLGELTR